VHFVGRILVHVLKLLATSFLSIPRVSSVKTQLIYCQLKWRHVSSQGVIIRPIIEPCFRYIKWKHTSSESTHQVKVHIKWCTSNIVL